MPNSLIPTHLLCLPGDRTPEEDLLEEKGDIQLLQRYRWNLHHNGKSTWNTDRVDLAGLLKVELALRENDQRHVALTGKLDARRRYEINVKLKFAEEITAVQSIESEIKKLIRDYWDLERRWWQIRSSFPRTPLSRGVDLWRSNPMWYLHQDLREDCAGRGGCCERDCGCCPKRRERPGRNLAAGHCTVECSCCEKVRGFELDAEQKRMYRKAFGLGSDWITKSAYATKMIQVSTLGLTAGDAVVDPFDKISDVTDDRAHLPLPCWRLLRHIGLNPV